MSTQQKFTKDWLRQNCGCYSQEELSEVSFMQSDGNEFTLKELFDSEIPIKDKYWFLCRKVASLEQNRDIAIHVAELVLPIWEKEFPQNKIPYEAIQAAKQYIAGHITLAKLIEKRELVYAATAATRAATAATAADAATRAAAAYAATAADAATRAAAREIKQQLHDYLYTFVNL